MQAQHAISDKWLQLLRRAFVPLKADPLTQDLEREREVSQKKEAELVARAQLSEVFFIFRNANDFKML